VKSQLWGLLALPLALGGCAASTARPESADALIRESRIAFPAAAKCEFDAPGRMSIRDARGQLLGRARYTEPASAGAVGFRGPVPVAVFLDPADRVVTAALLPNREDRRFVDKLRQAELSGRWSGFSRSEAAELEVDAVTGATYSSRAAIESVRALLREK